MSQVSQRCLVLILAVLSVGLIFCASAFRPVVMLIIAVIWQREVRHIRATDIGLIIVVDEFHLVKVSERPATVIISILAVLIHVCVAKVDF